MTGYTPWSLWSGLNDATRNQEITSGITASDYGLGGIGGTTNINARASQMRKGLRVSLVNGNAMYRFRAMVSYASGLQDNGWSYAFSPVSYTHLTGKPRRRALLIGKYVVTLLNIPIT